MATFPRTVLPERVSALWTPGALKQMSHNGVVQIRATSAVGWSWTEEWGLLNVRDVDHIGLLAFVTKTWNRGEIHDITHPLTPGSGVAPNGVGTGTILVDGASQVGDSILTDGWAINTPNSVRAGDVFKFAGDNAVYMAVADAGSNALGEVTIVLTMPLRLSPVDGAAVTRTGVTFRATLLDRSRFEGSRSPSYYAGLTLTFTEAL